MTRTRRHAAALATLALLGLSACSGDAETAEDPGSTPTPTVSGTPEETPSQTPTATPEEPEAPTTVSWSSQVSERATVDVDGDGREDSVELLVPKGTEEGDPADRAALRIGLADWTLEVEVADEPTYVWLGITTDPQDRAGIDLGNGPGGEVLVGASQGGDSAFLGVWSWIDGALEQVSPSGAPRSIAVQHQLAAYAEQSGFTLGGEGLYSWRLVDPEAGNEVTVWTWSVDGTTLTPTKQPGTQCVVVGELTDC